MTGLEMMERAKAHRTAAGLRLEWVLPEGRNYVAFAKDEAQKREWLANAERKDWELVSR